jgi:hypothetical protein
MDLNSNSGPRVVLFITVVCFLGYIETTGIVSKCLCIYILHPHKPYRPQTHEIHYISFVFYLADFSPNIFLFHLIRRLCISKYISEYLKPLLGNWPKSGSPAASLILTKTALGWQPHTIEYGRLPSHSLQ